MRSYAIRGGPRSHSEILRRADHAFRVLRFDRPREAMALRHLYAAWAEYMVEHERAGPDTPHTLERRDTLEALLAADLSSTVRVTSPTRAMRAIPAPEAHARRAHGIAWLPARPVTNPDPIEICLGTLVDPEHVAGDGLPISDPFLLVRPNAIRYATRQRAGFLLRTFVPGGGAVELSAHGDLLPARIQHRVREAADTLLLPLPWLPEARVVEVLELDGQGGLVRTLPWPSDGVQVRFTGASHGVPGLPNDSVRWPQRRPTHAYTTLPLDDEAIVARSRTHPGWLPLYRRAPSVPGGHYLLELEVGRGSAIDVRATLAALGDVPVAASSLCSYYGVELVLGAAEFATTRALRRRGASGHDEPGPPRPLSAFLPVPVPRPA